MTGESCAFKSRVQILDQTFPTQRISRGMNIANQEIDVLCFSLIAANQRFLQHYLNQM